MYHTGVDPRTMKPVYVPKTFEEKRMQRALLQFRNPKNQELVRTALEQTGRTDLIGFGPLCLAPPPKGERGAVERGAAPRKPAKGGTSERAKKASGGKPETRSNAKTASRSDRNPKAAAKSSPLAKPSATGRPEKIKRSGGSIVTGKAPRKGPITGAAPKRPSGNKKQQPGKKQN